MGGQQLIWNISIILPLTNRIYVFRHLLQLYHVYGGFLSRDNYHDSQLPPQIGRHAWNATLGK